LLKLDALTTWSYTASFLIRVTGDSTPLYVQADNSLGTTEVWRTRAQWGNPICINGLNPDTSYTFDIRGKITDELSVWGVPLENVLTNMAGDATGNNVVDVFDMIFVRDHLGDDRCSGISFQADVNDDGIVNILDLTFIRSRPNFTD